MTVKGYRERRVTDSTLVDVTSTTAQDRVEHSSLDHSGLTGVGITAAEHDARDHEGLTGVPADSLIRYATVTLTNAQTKALPTTSITLVAAPGAGLTIVPLFAHLRAAWVADYTNIDATATLFVGIGSNALLLPLRQGVVSQVGALLAGGGPDGMHATLPPIFAAASEYNSGGFSGWSALYDSDVANAALVLGATNGAAGDFTGGNAGNSLAVRVWYVTVPAA
jgi:hypothetical protein